MTRRTVLLRASAAGFLLAASLLAHAQDCVDPVRSVPSPLFAGVRAGIRAHSFALSSNHDAVERFEFGDGIQAEVRHGGCEYYVTTYRFSAPALFARGYTTRQVYTAAAGFLRTLAALQPNTASPPDLAAATLDAQARAPAAPVLGHEFAVDGDGVDPLQGGVVIDAAGRRKRAGFVQVTLFRGPL
jgi:hypothetical protein